jgi:hypothetical protein
MHASGRAPRRSDDGQVIVVFALSLLAIVAMAGLLIDGGRAWQDRRQAQIAADTGALAAAIEYSKGGASADTNAKTAARTIAGLNGFNAGTACNGTSLTSGTMVNGVSVTKPATDKVEVDVTRPMRTTFARAVGQGCWMVSARAVAHYTGAAVTGPTVFAAARSCPSHDVLKWNGSNITILGNIYSSGGVDINDNDGAIIGGTLTWYDNPPSCDNTIDNGAVPPVPAATTTTYLNYPITYTNADFPCTYVMTIDRIDGGGGPYWLDEAAHILKPGVYCRDGGTIKVGTRYTSGNVTLVADAVAISAADVSFTPYLNGVFIFADTTGSKAVNVSGANPTWGGLVFAPNGDVQIGGAGLSVFTGNIWGQNIELGGNDWTIQGSTPGSISPLEIVLIE